MNYANLIINGEKCGPDTLLVYVSNPKRKGSKAHARYESYAAATSVQEALDLGAVRADLKYDAEHGYLMLVEE